MANIRDIDITQFQIDPDKPLLADTPLDVIGYNLNGLIVPHDTPLCVAKAVDNSKYFIKMATDGLRAGKLFDPEVDSVNDLSLPSRATGRQRFEFRKVGRQSFDLYLTYLRDGGKSVLLNAERSIINGV